MILAWPRMAFSPVGAVAVRLIVPEKEAIAFTVIVAITGEPAIVDIVGGANNEKSGSCMILTVPNIIVG